MEWTTEAVKAHMDYRLEDARRQAVVRQLRDAGHPSWWRRLRSQHRHHEVESGRRQPRAA